MKRHIKMLTGKWEFSTAFVKITTQIDIQWHPSNWQESVYDIQPQQTTISLSHKKKCDTRKFKSCNTIHEKWGLVPKFGRMSVQEQLIIKVKVFMTFKTVLQVQCNNKDICKQTDPWIEKQWFKYRSMQLIVLVKVKLLQQRNSLAHLIQHSYQLSSYETKCSSTGSKSWVNKVRSNPFKKMLKKEAQEWDPK